MKFRLSLWAQLLLWVLIPVTLLRFGSSIYLLDVNRKALNKAYDDSLVETLRGLSTRLGVSDGAVTFDFPTEAAQAFSAIGQDRLTFQVVTQDGSIVSGPGDFEPVDAHPETVRFSLSRYRGEPVRIASLRVAIAAPGGNRVVYLRGAETLRGRLVAITEIDERLVMQQLLTVIMVTIAVLVGVRRALRPLRGITEELSKRSLADLRPVTVRNAPTEIAPLLDTINQLLLHIRSDLAAQQRFVSNAAHQLRTPLAGLKTSAELALRESTIPGMREMVAQILEGANRSVHLVKQLLAISRVEPGHGSEYLFADLDFAKLAREACKLYLAEALKKRIDLGYEGPDSLPFYGEATCLREMINNLIDNAVRYSPADGVVTVRVATVGPELVLIVEDSGSGIPQSERELVLERFYRVLGTGQDGSGLGLAIVREVAQMHRGIVAISEGEGGSGTRVTVRLHASSAPRELKSDAVFTRN